MRLIRFRANLSLRRGLVNVTRFVSENPEKGLPGSVSEDGVVTQNGAPV